ncbi:cupredoxin domain-containing protein [Streptomyces sp. NPDC094437]|uniref:cupredoxin domain-containing protein n=1 Tax=Streptomyces sp. NPDC094437 TaxID=3366060 RepID=UPI00381773D0
MAGIACLLLALTACSNSGSASSSSSASASPSGANRIEIKNFAFHPAKLTVGPGTVITVTNNDSATHTVTATGKKTFDTGDIGAGRTKTFTAPKTAGTYSYICTIHQYMKGTLTVT